MANRPPATIDGESGKAVMTVPRTPPLKLDNLRSIRDELGRVYRQARSGKLNTQDGTRLVYMLDKLRDLVIAIELEERLTALEEGNK